jgi:hypothetical protein
MAKISQLKILNSGSVDELKKTFSDLCAKKLKFNNYDLVIFPEDFDHCCYEYLEGGIYKGKFSLRRARKMLLIEQICTEEIEYKIIHQTHRNNKSIVVISELAEFCFIALPVKHKSKNYLRLLTMISFGKGIEGGMKKLFKNGDIIKPESLIYLFKALKKG